MHKTITMNTDQSVATSTTNNDIPRRTPMACRKCRGRKIKCIPITGSMNCRNCTKYGLACERISVRDEQALLSQSSGMDIGYSGDTMWQHPHPPTPMPSPYTNTEQPQQAPAIPHYRTLDSWNAPGAVQSMHNIQPPNHSNTTPYNIPGRSALDPTTPTASFINQFIGLHNAPNNINDHYPDNSMYYVAGPGTEAVDQTYSIGLYTTYQTPRHFTDLSDNSFSSWSND